MMMMLLFICSLQIKGRTIRVDHVANYRPPKDSDDIDDVTKSLREQGCAPKVSSSSSESEEEDDHVLPLKKSKKGCGTFLCSLKVVVKDCICLSCWYCALKNYTFLYFQTNFLLMDGKFVHCCILGITLVTF